MKPRKKEELTMENMLREALRKNRELRNQFENVLLGEDGEVWEKEAKKFLSKRPCWVKTEKEKKLRILTSD